MAIDGTGHSQDYANPLYTKKIEKITKKKRKSYTKNQIAIDTKTLIIPAHKVAREPRYDSKDAIANKKNQKI